jgi:stage II sporulation protein D
MDLELAVASVVAAESPPGAPLEALKAQAVAARSYFFAGRGGHKRFDFCDTTHCQFLREPPAPSAPSRIATGATRGLVLTFAGRPFPALYSASCGGRTHTLAELGLRTHDYPYYAVSCDYCRSHPDRWTVRLTPGEAASLSQRTESERLDLARRLGWSTLRSNEYLVSSHPDHAIVTGTGAGHGIGLCQRGAAALAQSGANFSTILAYYYPNTSLLTIEIMQAARAN